MPTTKRREISLIVPLALLPLFGCESATTAGFFASSDLRKSLMVPNDADAMKFFSNMYRAREVEPSYHAMVKRLAEMSIKDVIVFECADGSEGYWDYEVTALLTTHSGRRVLLTNMLPHAIDVEVVRTGVRALLALETVSDDEIDSRFAGGYRAPSDTIRERPPSITDAGELNRRLGSPELPTVRIALDDFSSLDPSAYFLTWGSPNRMHRLCLSSFLVDFFGYGGRTTKVDEVDQLIETANAVIERLYAEIDKEQPKMWRIIGPWE